METIKITKGDFLKNAGIVGMWNMLLVSDAKQGVNEDFWLDEEEQVLCISGEFAKNADWTDLYFKAFVEIYGPVCTYQEILNRIEKGREFIQKEEELKGMKQSFYIYNSGDIKRKDNTLQFCPNEGAKRDIPIERISDIYVMSEMTFNTTFLNYISQYGIPIHFFNYYNFYTGSYYPRESLLAGQLLVNQVEVYKNGEKRLEIAQKFIDAASFNIYRNLRYYNGRGKDVSQWMEEIEGLRRQITKTNTINELMGVEGNIRQQYYAAWNVIVNQEIDFKKRVMHPPDNMINSLISYVNSLIYAKILSEVYHTQLNPTISYLHEPGVRRYSLCLDVSEIFKPLIGDRLIFSLLNRNQITEESFTKELNFLHLKKDASKLIARELENSLKKTIKHKELGRQVSYQYLIRLELYKLIKHIIGEKEYEGFKIWW